MITMMIVLFVDDHIDDIEDNHDDHDSDHVDAVEKVAFTQHHHHCTNLR